MIIKPLLALVAVLGAAPVFTQNVAPSFSFMVVADTAYRVPHDYRNYDALIARMNDENPVFTIHLGDLFSGATDCGDKHINRAHADLDKFSHPVIYTPGDNEWTDCHAERAGGYDPEERLANIRSLFFKGPQSLGQRTINLEWQQKAGLPENTRWVHSGVLFATSHLVGSNNGLNPDTYQNSSSEFAKRDQANIAWIREAFEKASNGDVKALVLAYHADMFGEPRTPDGFAGVRDLIGELCEKLGKPVLLVHGDHHQFIVDRPYLPRFQEGPGANITRLQTYGWPDAKAVKVTVNTGRADMFTFQPVFDGKGIY